MSFWKLALVCLVVFTVSADLDADIELIGDLAKLQSLRGAIASRKGASGNGAAKLGFGGTETELELLDDETVELIGAISAGSRGASMGASKSASISKSASSSKPASSSGSKTSSSKPASSSSSKPASSSNSKPTSSSNSKPSTTSKQVTPTKSASNPTKAAIQQSTKQATNPTKKSTTNPSTKQSNPQSTKPSGSSQNSYKGSVANDQNYIKQLWQQENGNKVGFNSKTGKWTGNAAPEKGGKVDYGPGLKLPYKAGGYTQSEVDSALKSKITGIEGQLRKNVASMGKNYDNLSENQKKLLVDYSYNTGDAFGKFPKMSKAIVNGDVKGMNADYKRYYTDKSGQRKEIQQRNQWTKSVIDSFGK